MPWPAQVSLGQAPDPNDRQDVFIMYWWPDYARPGVFFEGLFTTEEKTLFTFSYYSNPVFDDLVSAAGKMAGISREEAINMYAEAQNILMEDVAGLAIYDQVYVRVISSSLKGYVDNPAYPHVVFWYDCYRE